MLSLVGGPKVLKKYVKCTGRQKIFYYDVVSLYPSVNALDDYAVGFPRHARITPEHILDGSFFGIVKVDITPPKDLYLPVLPDNSNGKLLFHLCELKEKDVYEHRIKKSSRTWLCY